MNDDTKEIPEIVSTADDQIGLNLTIYNADRALVKDRRRVTLPPGVCALAFREVSARIRPETALLSGGPAILEQNFEYDLLTPEALLQKYVGREVGIVRQNPTTGYDLPEQRAKVLSAANGAVLEVEGRIETGIPARLIYPDVPANLRDRPTLSTMVVNEAEGPQEVELSYLSGGLSWKADYVLELSTDEQSLNLNGWVTLKNESGASYRDAQLQLVAGNVHVVREMPKRSMRGMAGYRSRYEPQKPDMEEETLLEYHLYTLGRSTTIGENQQKQVALLQARDVQAHKLLVLRGGSHYYSRQHATLWNKLDVDVMLEIKNEKEQGLGLPIPAGTMRVYKKDSRGQAQFVGEDRIGHTPEKETIRLHLGKAFDVTAARQQTAFDVTAKQQTDFKEVDEDTYTSSYKITVNNAKDTPVRVTVIEPIPGKWTMLETSVPLNKENGNNGSYASWLLDVPAKGESELTYTVKVEE